MQRTTWIALSLLIACLSFAGTSRAEDGDEPQGDKLISGMSIVGNDEAPKSLVIVPWKSSDMGDSLQVTDGLDDGRDPVDREVFGRALDYYEIRTGAPKRN